MQKKLIALAVASLASGAAFARTNVTMYGIADSAYVYGSGGDNDFSGVQSGMLSGSRLGFRGEEALGNGLKAVFTLEYSLDIDGNKGVGYSDTEGGLNARQQFVGLASNWGTVALGRQYAPGYQATVNNDPFAGATFSPTSFLTAGAGNSISPGSPARWNNAATFTSNNYSGFSFKGIYAFGEYAPTNTLDLNNGEDNIWDDGAWGLGANYANGPINIDAVYQSRMYRRTNATSLATTYPGVDRTNNANGGDTDEWYIGGSFDLKFVKLMASYQDQSDNNNARSAASNPVTGALAPRFPNNDNSTWTVGAVIPIMSSSNIHLGYAELDMDQGGGAYDGKSQSFAAAFTHNLSKRTTLYAGYVWVDNDNDSIGAAPVKGLGVRDDDNNTFLAGVRHTF